VQQTDPESSTVSGYDVSLAVAGDQRALEYIGTSYAKSVVGSLRRSTMTVRKAIATTARRALRLMGVRAVRKTAGGDRIYIPVEVGALRPLLFDRSYSGFFGEEEFFTAVSSRVCAEDTIFDIGAYIGVHSVLLSRIGRRVVAFEPNPAVFRVLLETTRANNAVNVNTQQLAVAESSGAAYLAGIGSGASLSRSATTDSDLQVASVDLDTFAERHELWPDVMKIDVEGYECEVFRGATRCLQTCRVVGLELHLDLMTRHGGSADIIYSLMAEHGFRECARIASRRHGTSDPTRVHVVFERTQPT